MAAISQWDFPSGEKRTDSPEQPVLKEVPLTVGRRCRCVFFPIDIMMSSWISRWEYDQKTWDFSEFHQLVHQDGAGLGPKKCLVQIGHLLVAASICFATMVKTHFSTCYVWNILTYVNIY